MEPADAFAELMRRDDEELPLDRAALLLAAVEYPDLDVDGAMILLDGLADVVLRRLGGSRQPDDVVRVMAGVLHAELGFHGNADAYYDPRNSYLNEVLNRRLGIPISLSALYLAIGQRLDLPLEGVGMPGHFLVRLRDQATPVVVDPFADGAVLTDADCAARLRGLYGPSARFTQAMLAPVSTRQIVFRMLNNLKGIYSSQEDWRRVVRTIDLMLLTQPGASSEYRDRGMANMRAGNLRRARADFEHYLLNAAEIHDAGTVREQLALVERLETMRN